MSIGSSPETPQICTVYRSESLEKAHIVRPHSLLVRIGDQSFSEDSTHVRATKQIKTVESLLKQVEHLPEEFQEWQKPLAEAFPKTFRADNFVQGAITEMGTFFRQSQTEIKAGFLS